MKITNIKNVFSSIQSANDEFFLKDEKITIMNRSKLFIQNYDDLVEINDHFIQLSRILIKGNHLKIISISKYFIEISGEIKDIRLGEKNHEA